MLLLPALLLLAAPCSGAEHSQLDFLVGEWSIESGGAPMGRDVVRKVAGGCALDERLSSPSGWEGVGLYRFDAAERAWRQSWVDSKGNLLEFRGRADRDGVVFTGTAGGVRQRVTYRPLSEGGFTQRHEVAADGKPWKVVFDARFTAAPPAASRPERRRLQLRVSSCVPVGYGVDCSCEFVSSASSRTQARLQSCVGAGDRIGLGGRLAAAPLPGSSTAPLSLWVDVEPASESERHCGILLVDSKDRLRVVDFER